ncbi:hypothetical protein FSP39_017526 [Pinctada imbricata]|uniref:Fanconi anemia group I protein n=1 Tax=Pinctada imbricata TaxID=66713 RepID=A0AA88Y0N1_PINIB|nr:hypothetical protein FSP39_017526 [Pinctada imbricata]
MNNLVIDGKILFSREESSAEETELSTMDKVIPLAEDGNIEKLSEILKGDIEKELLKLLESRLLRGKGDPVSLLRSILQALNLRGDSDGKKICVTLYRRCINVLEKSELSSKLSSDILAVLMIEADSLNGPGLAELSYLYVDMVKNGDTNSGKGLELLPKILSALAIEENICYSGSSMCGSDYKGHILNSLCSCKWSSESVLHLAAMFKDVTLTTEELKFVIEKVLRMMKELELPDLPALVYQLLLLATKGHKKLVLEGITEFFVEQDKAYQNKSTTECSEDLLEGENSSVETLKQTEGTVILHISFAVKQDQELGREFIKFLKANQAGSASKTMVPFVLALSLSLSRIHRFEEQIFDLLKATVLKSYKDAEKQEESHWVREVVPEKSVVDDYAIDTVQNSVHGWDHVVQGLVQLGFLLMDAFGPKASFGRTEVTSPQTGPTHRACQLGSKILTKTFKAHQMVRAEILEQIFNRVVTKTSAPVCHFLDLLSTTVTSFPQILLECTPKIRETFDYLSFLTPNTAQELLRAIQPLLKISVTLRDALILVLRKAMFSKQLDSRKIGVSGFLMILKQFRVLGGLQSSQTSQSFSFSQITVDVHARCNPASNEALCLEIMGNLRRVLTQQADVRLMLYQGLYEALCKNTQLQGSVLEILLLQLKKYYEPTKDVNPPVKLELCIAAQGEQVYLAEPLAHLLCCVQLSLRKVMDIQRQTQEEDEDCEDNMEDIGRMQGELEDMMESLVQRMIKSELEDFELDKSADFSLAGSVGVKNNIFAILVLGVYETLMEYNFQFGQLCESSLTEIIQLYENHKKLSDILREKVSSAAGKKGGKISTGKTPHSLLSVGCVVSMVETVLGDTAPSNRETVSILQENSDFKKYLMGVALQKLQQIQDKGACDGAEGSDKNKLLKHLRSLGRVLLQFYAENQKSSEGRKNKCKIIYSQCLDGLVVILNIITHRYPDHLTHSLSQMAESSKTDDQEIMFSHIKKYQRMVNQILSTEDEEKSMKEVSSLLHIVFLLSKQLLPSGGHLEKVLDWVTKLCTEQNIDDLPTCKSLFTMLLGLTRQVKSSLPLIRELTQDIHSQLGDVDQEVEVEDKTHYSLVTHRTAAPMLMLLTLQHCEQEMEDTEWVLARLKADVTVITGNESDAELSQREGHEKSVCNRLGILVTAFHELLQSTIPVGVCMEAIIKQTTRLYTAITTLVKYYLHLYQQRAGHLSSRFEKLVKLIGTHLTQYVYAMITYIQQAESDQVQQNVDKGKKDKKKQTAALQAGRAKVMKESKTIPNLIFAVETLEKFLIQLSKKSKVNLMEHMKLSTSRDFRINIQAVQTAMEEDSDEASDDSDDDTTQQNQDDKSTSDSDKDQENVAPTQNKRPRESEEETSKPTKKSKLMSKSKLGQKQTKS